MKSENKTINSQTHTESTDKSENSLINSEIDTLIESVEPNGEIMENTDKDENNIIDSKVAAAVDENLAVKTKSKKPVIIAVSIAVLVIVIVIYFFMFSPIAKYNKANDLVSAGKYDEAISIFKELGDYNDSSKKIKICQNVSKAEQLINNIGKVSLNSKEAIEKADAFYNNLSSSEKDLVKNKNILEESKKTYSKLLLDSLEDSSLYKNMQNIFYLSMASYNPNMTLDKEEKTLNMTFSVSSDITDLLIYSPTRAKPAWNMLLINSDGIAKSCYDLLSDYGIKVVLEIYSEDSHQILYRSVNGETEFNILD